MEVAERKFRPLFAELLNALQWSRDLEVAESKQSVFLGPLVEQLQWSRDLEVAESGAGFGAAVLILLASMEPRLGSRGKATRLEKERADAKLQWSRDLEVAESGTSGICPAWPPRFNGAAT